VHHSYRLLAGLGRGREIKERRGRAGKGEEGGKGKGEERRVPHLQLIYQ